MLEQHNAHKLVKTAKPIKRASWPYQKSALSENDDIC